MILIPHAMINGINLYYELHGQGEPLALLNGIMQSTDGWTFQTPVFARNYQVLLHDMRGQGRSDKPAQEYSWERHVDDFQELLNHLNIPKVHVTGVSYGAEVAMHFALKYPQRVRSLLLGTAASELTPLLRAFAESWEVAATCRDGYNFFKLLAPSIYGGNFLATHREWLERRAQAFAKVVTNEWFDGFERLLKNFYTLNITPRLCGIQTPTLVIAAEKDILKPVELSSLIREQITAAEMLVIPDSGHVAIFEKPGEFNSAVLGFLAKQS